MILFLDFDGVLHPLYSDAPTPSDVIFCHLPRFESVMRDFPTVKIVISSMWRYDFSLDKLKENFSPDIANRIIGTTHLTCQTNVNYAPTRREGEILDWLADSGYENTPWLALDDAVWQFDQYLNQLIPCTWYIGLNDAVEAKLRSALKAAEF
jgi:HAD domain in Swiss Army Knife RNA repair proteins